MRQGAMGLKVFPLVPGFWPSAWVRSGAFFPSGAPGSEAQCTRSRYGELLNMLPVSSVACLNIVM